AQVAEEMPKGKVANDILVLPARGGLGKDVETQANSIAANLAKKLDGNYRLLHVPDNIEQEAINALLKVSEVKEFVDIIKKLDILVFGIGRADVMAERRKVSEETIEELIDRGAVAEAFGHYFDTNGNRVWESITVGLSLVDFKKVNNVIGVAGGEKKAEAIISISSIREDMILVTDEGAARKILKLVN
ncbi:sugar-binding domain-containing protein, partial [Anaerosalibacter bizertensis]|nr:sugar-binding domain-containing protein [Anaerosalibacter bizertensis]